MCMLGKLVKVVEVDSKNALIGYRCWYRKNKNKLESLNSPDHFWDVNAINEADRPPTTRNDNGLYCYNPDHKRLALGTLNPYKGKIKIWGKIAIHKKGYRAQYGAVIEIINKDVAIAAKRIRKKVKV